LQRWDPRGGDEVNLIEKGANYGWPIVTHGREYWGPRIGEGATKEGFKESIAHWTPSISPSAIAFYTGDAFPKWKNNAFLANLSGQHLRRLVIEGDRITHQEALLGELNLRFRNLRSGPDGYLYVSTDDGKIARLVPVKKDD
jgi:aldose sugar dehydrogenase